MRGPDQLDVLFGHSSAFLCTMIFSPIWEADSRSMTSPAGSTHRLTSSRPPRRVFSAHPRSRSSPRSRITTRSRSHSKSWSIMPTQTRFMTVPQSRLGSRRRDRATQERRNGLLMSFVGSESRSRAPCGPRCFWAGDTGAGLHARHGEASEGSGREPGRDSAQARPSANPLAASSTGFPAS